MNKAKESEGDALSCKSGVPFTNWSKTFTCFPFRSFYPNSESQVIRVIALARKSLKKVRVAGGGLSPSDLVCTQDFLIYTDRLDKILEVSLQLILD